VARIACAARQVVNLCKVKNAGSATQAIDALQVGHTPPI
jgi:hypothetical protein